MQDSISGLAGCVSNREGRDLVWKFLQKNWSSLVERFGEKSSFLVYFVEVNIDWFILIYFYFYFEYLI